MQEEDKTTEQKAKANKIIRLRSALAAGTGLLSFPVLVAAAVRLAAGGTVGRRLAVPEWLWNGLFFAG